MVDEAILLKALKIISSEGDHADIYLEDKSSLHIKIEDDRIEKIISGNDSGIGLRIIKNFKSYYAHSNDLSPEGILNLASDLRRMAISNIDETDLSINKLKPPVEFNILKRPDTISLKDKLHLALISNKIARGVSPLIKQVTINYTDTIKRVTILNSRGHFVTDERIYTTFTIHTIASMDGEIQVAYEPVGGFSGFEIFERYDIEEISKKTAERAIMFLRARKAPGGRMPVVISSEAGGTLIHEAIGHGLEADLAQNGLSVFSGKIGSSVASPLITVIDDSTLAEKRGSFRFDDEGIPSQRTVLVENGILKNYMYDMLTSMKDNAKPTGNGRRESYRFRPIPRMTNTFIAPGKDSPEEILRSVEKGLFVKKMGGGQVNTVTGDFVFEVQEGYLIEKGSIGEPLRGATLTGNGPEILKSIDMVGNDLGFSIGTCGKDGQGVPVSDAMPTLRIPEMVVGGMLQK